MEKILENIDNALGLDNFINILWSIFVILVLFTIMKLFKKVINKRIEDVKLRYKYNKNITYIFVITGIIILSFIWFSQFKYIGTFIGIFSAGLAIALKDPITNLAGWMFILWRKPFEVGDRIEIDSTKGDVIDLRAFQFSMLEVGNWVDAEQSTGRIIQVPNGKIFIWNLANYSKGFKYIWNEIPVLITFESDWRKAKKILSNIANESAQVLTEEISKQVKSASREYMIFYNNLTPIVYTTVKDSGVMLTIRYMCEPNKRRSSQQAIWEAVLDEFAKNENISLAYPTLRNVIDGKIKNENH